MNKSIKTDKSCSLCEDMLRKTAAIIQSSLDSQQTWVHPMTSMARHFPVLTHALELHTKNHVDILGSQKKVFKMFFKVLSPAYSNISGLKKTSIAYMKQTVITTTRLPETDINYLQLLIKF